MSDVQDYIAALVAREGGYVADPADPGGETNHGITAAVARAYGYDGPMAAMPLATAQAIYQKRYWLLPRLDQLDAICPTLAVKLLDIGVNMGQAIGIRFLQRALNVLNEQGQDFPDVVVDGMLGPVSLRAVQLFLARRGEEGRQVLLAMIRAQQAVRYIEIAEGAPSQERFEFGWQRARAML
jgi:lysozyme family protein